MERNLIFLLRLKTPNGRIKTHHEKKKITRAWGEVSCQAKTPALAPLSSFFLVPTPSHATPPRSQKQSRSRSERTPYLNPGFLGALDKVQRFVGDMSRSSTVRPVRSAYACQRSS